MSRFAATCLACSVFGIGTIAVVAEADTPPDPAPATKRALGSGARERALLVANRRLRGEKRVLLEQRRQLRAELARERRVLLHDPTVTEAINVACATYGYCSTLWRKASCETGGTFNPHAYNSSSGASGLFQFLGSTWRSTPYGRLSVWSPYANSMAAGWMHAHGRGGEWSCR